MKSSLPASCTVNLSWTNIELMWAECMTWAGPVYSVRSAEPRFTLSAQCARLCPFGETCI